MNTKSATAHRACLPPWLAVVLLGLFLAARGLVPAGFMPSAVAGGTLYQLCHGDSRSALLLKLVTPAADVDNDHTGHGYGHTVQSSPHQHDSATAKAFSDNHCSFASAVASILTSADSPWSPLPGFTACAPAPAPVFSQLGDYLLPPGRAPPIVFTLA